MNERLKQLRSHYGLKQKDFAELLGYSRELYCMLENGKTPLNPRHIQVICSTLNVNESWLEDGIGNMFNQQHQVNDFVNEFLKLDEKSQQFVSDMIKTLLTRQDEEE